MSSRRAKLNALIAAGLAAVLAGCAAQSPSPRCATGCARVHGRVERCGGPAPGRCEPAHVRSVSLLNSRGRVIRRDIARHDGSLSRFSLIVKHPGRYTLRADIAGTRVTRPVDLRTGHLTAANLTLQIK
jgi:hypothetical protein